MDFRGHGKSRRSPPYRYKDHISDTIAFVERNMKEKTVLFGSSLGGMISLMVAAKRPDIVKAVIFGDANIRSANVHETMVNYHSYWEGWRRLACYNGNTQDLVKAVAEMPVNVPSQGKSKYGEGLDIISILNRSTCLRHLDPIVLCDWAKGGEDAEAFRNVMQGYEEELLRRITCPVLLIQENVKRGAIMTDGEVEYALSVLPHAYHIYIEEYDHNLGLYSWKKVRLLQAANTFLESLR